MNNENRIYKYVLDASKLPIVGAVFISYLVGTGFVSYVGRPINGLIFWLGLAIVWLFFLSSEFLAGLNFYSIPQLNLDRTLQVKLKNIFLQLCLSCLSVGAGLTVFIFLQGKSGLDIWLFLALFFILNVVLVMNPQNLRNTGFRDLLNALNLTVLTPAFAVILQLGELHRSLLLITFPIFFLIIAIFLAFSLENYYENLKTGYKTLMTVFGWKMGMNIHNLFLLIFYLTYGIGAALGLPSRLLIPALAAFPFSALEFWEMWRISIGEKPRWKFLKFCAWATVGVLSYFLLFELWFG